MSNGNRQEIEVHGPTVEAAVATGLQRLGLTRDEVSITVVDEGSRGLLGIGSRDAVVRMAPRSSSEGVLSAAEKPSPPTTVIPPASAETSPKPGHDVVIESGDDTDRFESAADLELERETAEAIITELLDKMRVRATVTGRLTAPDDLTGEQINLISIDGEDLGVLIGPRGETLDSLQYITRLMVAHRIRRRTNFVVDVEGYRQRREQALARLAERMADKVRQRQEPISLEPMPAYERRIIHLTLRDAPDVYTESTGEGKQRRVRIYPKS